MVIKSQILWERNSEGEFLVISLDSAFKEDDNYSPQLFLKECKYIKKKLVIDNLESS